MEIDWLFQGRDVGTYGIRKDTEKRIFEHLTEDSRRVSEAQGEGGFCIWYQFRRWNSDDCKIRRQKKYRVHVAIVLYQLFHGIALEKGGHGIQFSHTCDGRRLDEAQNHQFVCVNPWHLLLEEHGGSCPGQGLGKRKRTGSAEENALQGEGGRKRQKHHYNGPYHYHQEGTQRHQRTRQESHRTFWDKVLGSSCPLATEEAERARALNKKRRHEDYRTLADYRYGQTHIGRMLAPPPFIVGVDKDTERAIIREMQTRSAELEDMSPQELLLYIPPRLDGTMVFRESTIRQMRTFLAKNDMWTPEYLQGVKERFLQKRSPTQIPEVFPAIPKDTTMSPEEMERFMDTRFIRYPLGSRETYQGICDAQDQPQHRSTPEPRKKRVRFMIDGEIVESKE